METKQIDNQIVHSVVEFFGSIKRSIVRTLERVRYISKLFPLLWNNYWWDFSTLDALLLFELRYRANRFRHFGMCESAEKHAEQMDAVADSLESFLLGEIESKFTTEWEAQHPGFFKMNWEKLENGMYKLSETGRDVKLTKAFAKQYAKATAAQHKARQNALKLFAEKSENWWD